MRSLNITLILVTLFSNQSAFGFLKACCSGASFCQAENSCSVVDCCAAFPEGNPGGNGGNQEGKNCGNLQNGTHCKISGNVTAVPPTNAGANCIIRNGLDFIEKKSVPLCERFNNRIDCEAKKTIHNNLQCYWQTSIR